MQRNINFFDNNGIFVIVVQSRKATAENILDDKISKESERDILTFLSSPFLERLPDSIILVQRNDDLFDLWSQVISGHFAFLIRILTHSVVSGNFMPLTSNLAMKFVYDLPLNA